MSSPGARYSDGTGRFSDPTGVAVAGRRQWYMADNLLIRQMVVVATGAVSTLAGGLGSYADGVGAAAKFAGPSSVTADASGGASVALAAHSIGVLK